MNGEEFYAKADVHLIVDPFTNHLKASILIKIFIIKKSGYVL